MRKGRLSRILVCTFIAGFALLASGRAFATSPASCRDIYESGVTTSGDYTIDPDGEGGADPISVYCLMSLSGGGWTKLTAAVASTVLNTDTAFVREYLYVQDSTSRWYRTPKSRLAWSWSSGQDLYGIYFSSGPGESSFVVKPSGELQHYGVGGSSGGGGTYKCLVAYDSYKDSSNAQVELCQDLPGIFCGACCGGVTVYLRENRRTGPEVFKEFESFENGWGDWSSDNYAWEIRVPGNGPVEAHSGTNAACGNLGGNYSPSQSSRLISPILNVPQVDPGNFVLLHFWQWYQYGTGDSGSVQVSRFNGSEWSNWETLQVSASTGSSGAWQMAPPVDLTPYQGQQVRLAFYTSANDDSDVGPGWFIDDVQVNRSLPDTATLGQDVSGSFTSNGDYHYYVVTVPPGGHLHVSLDDLDNSGINEIYVRQGALPSRGAYDYRYANSGGADQEIVVPDATPGLWYVLVYTDSVGANGDYTLHTDFTTGVILSSVTPNRVGNAGTATITIDGAGFDPGTTVDLVQGQNVIPVADVSYISGKRLIAKLDLSSVIPGSYRIRVQSGASSSDLGFEVLSGGTAKLKANLVVPSWVGYHVPSTLWVEYTNEGEVAMPAPLVVVTARQGGRQAAIMKLSGVLKPSDYRTSAEPQGFSTTVQFLGSGDTPGILQPGESFRVPVQYAGWLQPWDYSYPPINFSLGVLEAGDTTAVDWTSYRDGMRPPSISEEAWAPIWGNFVAQAGNTWGDYVAMLTDNSSYLNRLGEKVTDIGDLLAFELEQADGMSVVRTVASATDAYAAAPGIELVFRRVFPNSISRRYALGALGRGWSHNWDTSLQIDADGTVTVLEPGGGRRIFKPDSRGDISLARNYFAMDGDHGRLTWSWDTGAYSLRETNGLLRVFRSDGKLDYVEDTNGNRITPSYSGNQLMGLIHSAGQTLQFTYDANGHIATVTDPNGRQTTYTYDAGGQHLQSVAYFDGSTLQYAYSIGNGSAGEHALTQIGFSGGTHQYFSYDARGRLASASRDGGAEAVSFAYNAGTTTLIDAFNNHSDFYLDNQGLLVKVRDPQGATTQLTYDQQFNLTKVADPAGGAYQYAYDDKGNLVRSVDPLGSATQFAYAGPFDRMTGLTDANGNRTNYAYTAAGNRSSITYADNSVESWAYTTSGDASSWNNRRNHTIGYEHDTVGRLTAKVLPDSTRIEYHYDPRGNLASTVDPTGTTTLEYDSSDRPTKITYPGNRWLSYTYNAASQRASMLNQLGHRLDYHYDAAGRLESMTDETSAEIVRYIYDASGRLQRKNLGNGVYTLYEYDAASQPTSLINYKPDSSVLSQFVYTYDTRGRRTSMTANYGIGDPRTSGRWDYSYDAVGQLTAWTGPDGRHVEYRYDPLGNRITVNDTGAVTSYTTNKLNQYAQVGEVTYQYDMDGNLTQRVSSSGATIYTFDDQNRLVAVSGVGGDWQYSYDAFGSRVRMDYNGEVTGFVVDPIGLGNLVGEYATSGGDSVSYDYAFDLLMSRANAGQAKCFTFDCIGSTSEVTDESSAVLSAYSFPPFGNVPGISDTKPLFGYTASSGAATELTMFAYLRARYFSFELGRFTSTDPIGLRGGVNLYEYAGNDPVTFTDPSGLQMWGAPLKIGGGFPSQDQRTSGLFKLSIELQQGAINYNNMRYGRYRYWNPEKGEPEWRDPPPAPKRTMYVPYQQWRNGNIHSPGTDVQPSPDWGPDDGKCPSCPPGYTPPGIPDPSRNAGQWPTNPAGSGDPNGKIGPSGYGGSHLVANATVLPYRINFENEAAAAAPAQVVTVSDQLDGDLDWTTFELTAIGFGDVVLAVPPGSQHFETSVSMTFNGVTFEVQIEAGIHIATGQVYANFYSIDPATGLPPPVDVGFLPPEDGTGRGDGYFTYIVKPKSGLAAGTQIRNVAQISFDYQSAIFTNQVDPHDPSRGTDPNKEALNTIAPATATLTIASGAGGSVTSPGLGAFVYDWGQPITLVANPNPGSRFVSWTGDVSTVADVSAATTSIGLYGNFSVTANFAPLQVATPTPTPTATATPEVVDVAVLARGPLTINIPSGTPQVPRTLSIAVRNADRVDRTIALDVDGSGCPMGLAGTPDFDSRTTGSQSSILVRAGKMKTAKVPLVIHSSDFTTFNHKAPTRCALVFTARAVVSGGTVDPMPSNNTAVVELNVVDKNDAEHTERHESYVKSVKPTSLKIALGKQSQTKVLRATIGNADYQPVAETPGDAITLSASTDCAGLALSGPICDSTNASSTATVMGGGSRSCHLTALADAAQISTHNKLSPQRCVVTLTATGPSNPETPPLDATNNVTELLIDVLDKNDLP
jgi:RHS repeat-associated protein